MKKIIGYLKEYLAEMDKRVAILSVVFIGIAIYINYHYGLNHRINTLSDLPQFASWYLVFFIAFSFPYLVQAALGRSAVFSHSRFIWLLLIAPALFAWKMAIDVSFRFTPNAAENAYWNQVFYWPFKLIVFILALFILHQKFDKEQSFYGFTLSNFQATPYLIMLLIMVPLIIAASTQADFLAMYPKMGHVAFLKGQGKGWYKWLYELSYGSDFLSIELFFRGFLVLAFAKFAGKDALLPMACYYCTIHFGKPLGECISSFFGGLILGLVTYHTRTIFGGLMVHLGIAWLMELGGYLGNQ